METKSKVKVLENFLNKIFFDKHGVEIEMSEIPHKYSWDKKYLIKIYVDPFKFNVEDSDYWDFLTNLEDNIEKGTKYFGVDLHEIVFDYIPIHLDEYSKYLKHAINSKWKEVSSHYKWEVGDDLPKLESIEINRREKMPELNVTFKLNEELSSTQRKVLWELVHEYLPISTMFVDIVP